MRRLATDADMLTSDREKSYVLMYEKCQDASQIPRPLPGVRHEQRSVSLVESASKSQPLIEDISHFEDTATPARDSEDDSNVEEIVMESPPYIPAQHTASSCAAFSRDVPARPHLPSPRADTSSIPFQASADFNVSRRDHSVPVPSHSRAW